MRLQACFGRRQKAIFKLNNYSNFKPITWAFALSFIPGDAPEARPSTTDFYIAVDNYFIREANRTRMPILSIECDLEQNRGFAGLSMPLQILMLEDALDMRDSPSEDALTADYLLAQLELWRKGNEQALLEFIRPAIEDPRFAELWDFMGPRRRYVMANRASYFMAQGKNVFFVVGAAHLISEVNVIDLLVQRGYTAERMGREKGKLDIRNGRL